MVRGPVLMDGFVVPRENHEFDFFCRTGGTALVAELVTAACGLGIEVPKLEPRLDTILVLSDKTGGKSGGDGVLRGEKDFGFRTARDSMPPVSWTNKWGDLKKRVLVVFHRDASSGAVGDGDVAGLVAKEDVEKATHIILQSYVPPAVADDCSVVAVARQFAEFNPGAKRTLVTSANAMQRANHHVVLGSSIEEAAASVAAVCHRKQWHHHFGTVIVRLGMEGVLVIRSEENKPDAAKVRLHYVFKNKIPRNQIECSHLVGFTSIATAVYVKWLRDSEDTGDFDAGEVILKCAAHFYKGYGKSKPDAAKGEKKAGELIQKWPKDLFDDPWPPENDPDGDKKKPGVFCHEQTLKELVRQKERWSLLEAMIAPAAKEPKVASGIDKFVYDIVTVGQAVAAAGVKVPLYTYGALNVMDRPSAEGYLAVEALLRKYAEDRHWRQPLCIGVFGAPGSGKSFGVSQIVSSLKDQELNFADKPSEFNVSQFTSLKDLANALHTARDIGLSGKIPLVFFDEFDSTFNDQQFGWLKYFLMPMQDGQFKDADSIYHTGRAVLIFAGGINHCFNEFRERVRNINFCEAKGPDFIGRLRGVIDVAGLQFSDEEGVMEETTWPAMARRIQSAILLRSTLQKVWKLRPDEKIEEYDKTLVDSFLSAHYRHGVRSMEAILQMGNFRHKKLMPWGLPTDAQLDLHVSNPMNFKG